MQYVQRAGASNRTADELGEIFVLDTIDLVRDKIGSGSYSAPSILVATGLETELASLVWAEGYSRWLECEGEHVDQPEILQELVREAECLLGDIGLGVEWDDGYVIHDESDWDDDGNLNDEEPGIYRP